MYKTYMYVVESKELSDLVYTKRQSEWLSDDWRWR